MLQKVYSLSTSAATKVAFKAKMDSAAAAPVSGTDQRCFGPFNTNVPIPYSITTLNEAAGYNPSLGKNRDTIAFLYSTFKPDVILCCLLHGPGVFTAPKAGVYSFSFTVYSYVQLGARIYHKVSVPKNCIYCCASVESQQKFQLVTLGGKERYQRNTVFVTCAQVQLMKNGIVVASAWENNREDGEDSATQVRRESRDINVTWEVQTRPCSFLYWRICVLSGRRAGNEERRPGLHGADVRQEALQPSAVQQLQRTHCLPRDGRLAACRCYFKGPILLLLSDSYFNPRLQQGVRRKYFFI